MMKKKKSKPESIKTNGEKELKPSTQAEEQATEEKPFDFGGLPNRDLKKNLGCG